MKTLEEVIDKTKKSISTQKKDLTVLLELQKTGAPIKTEKYKGIKIFVTSDYSFADDVVLEEDKNSDRYGLDEVNSWIINYVFSLPTSDGDQRVYCREDDWKDSPERLAAQSVTTSRDGNYFSSSSTNVYHGPSLDILSNHYRKLGASNELLNRMEKEVKKIRKKHPMGKASNSMF